MYYPCSENKGADQLRGYREADLRLCFRLCRLLVFSRGEALFERNKEKASSETYLGISCMFYKANTLDKIS